MNLEFLVATMNRSSLSFLKKMNLSGNILVINQYNDVKLQEDTKNGVRYLNYKEKGLSKSRNRALENAIGDICVLADDDLKYVSNVEDIIKQAYKKYIDADVIVFQIKNSNGELYKKYSQKEHRIGRLNSMKVSSVEITFKRKSIIDNKIIFDEKFGAGAKYYCGEENIFLSKCIDNKLKIIYIPTLIGQLQDSESSWFCGYDEKYFKSKGAVFYKLFNKLYPIIIIQFAIRKRKLFGKNNKINKTVELMFRGVKEIKKEGK